MLSLSVFFPSFFVFFRPLLFSVLTTQPLFLLFLFFPFPPHSCFLGAPFRSRFFGSPLSLQPDFSCLPSRFSYSAFCLFPFILPCFAPTAVPQVLAFCFRLRPFSFLFPLSFVRFFFQFRLLSLCFFRSFASRLSPHSCFLGARLPPLLLTFSTFSSA